VLPTFEAFVQHLADQNATQHDQFSTALATAQSILRTP
jgi:hypothetical protein